MADNFLLSLAGNLAEHAEEVGIEEAMEKFYEKHPDKWNQDLQIALAFAGLVNQWEAETKSNFLKKLEEGLVIAVNVEAEKHPIIP